MSDIKLYEPLWDEWFTEALIGEGPFGKVYKVSRQEFENTRFSAAKMASLPQSHLDIQRMEIMGYDNIAIHDFFEDLLTYVIEDIDLMIQFRGTDHIISFEDYEIFEKPDSIGWDILIRMELLRSLSSHITAPLDQAEVLKLGIHICRALEFFSKEGIIHRNIKPENIFISPLGHYKLGDFGILRQIGHTLSGVSSKGTYTTMAPEVFRKERYGADVDTYALGIVMYSLLNQNRIPFMPRFPQPILPSHRDTALLYRMNGEPIPNLRGVNPALNDLVLRACAYSPADRFADPSEMREALEGIAFGNHQPATFPRPQKHQKSLSIPPDKKPLKPRKKIPLIIALTSLAGLTLIVAAIILSGIIGSQEYGISINGQTDIILSSQTEAQAVLDELSQYYTDLAAAPASTVSSLTYEEDVEILKTPHPPITMNKQEALEALIHGKAQTIDYTAAEGETVNEIAQKNSISAQSILAQNEGLSEDSPLTEGTQLTLVLFQPYLHVIIEGEYEVTEDVDFLIESVEDPNLIINTTEIQQPGEKGSKTIKYSYTSKNGVILEKTLLAETVVTEPINEIVLKGTKPSLVGKNLSQEEMARIFEEVGREKNIPPEILKAIGWVESGWGQFRANGEPKVSGNGPTYYVGVMQIGVSNKTDTEVLLKLKTDIRYNIAYGADMLNAKWEMVPSIGDNDRTVLENWYFAVWAYNSWIANNKYPGKIINLMANPQYIAVPATLTPTDIPAGTLPKIGNSYPTPTPSHISVELTK